MFLNCELGGSNVHEFLLVVDLQVEFVVVPDQAVLLKWDHWLLKT